MRNRYAWIVAVVFLMGFAALATAEVTTTRDERGVWHIKGEAADSLRDVFEEMGYAVACDRLWQAESFRRAAKGALAEILGPDFLDQDKLVRLTGYSTDELTAAFQALDEETRSIIEGYVAGFNRRIAEVTADPSKLPFEFHALAAKLQLQVLFPAPWTPEDVLAWEALMLKNFDPEAQEQGQLKNAALLQFLSEHYGKKAYGMFNDLRWMSDPAAVTYIPKTRAVAPKKTAASPTTPPAFPPGVDLQAVAGAMESRRQDQRERLKQIGAYVKMGSYAWVISGEKTASGKPILYSGPQMGFDTPAIISEGSIEAGGLSISGMNIAGLPGIVIGRTPHHVWSMQVGHARTVDYYFEPAPADAPPGYYVSRLETIKVAGQGSVDLMVYRSPHGPIVSPRDFNPDTYNPTVHGPIVSWRYSHWNKEFGTVTAYLKLSRAQSMDAFGEALREVGVSQHFCYADKDGNIAYWMSGMDPVRPDTVKVDEKEQLVDWRLPQGMFGFQAEWGQELKPLATDRNTARGFYTGWNSRASQDYENAINNQWYCFGPFHRAHVLEDYLSQADNLTFEQVRDLAINIATTDSLGYGGNPWKFVEAAFRAAVAAHPTEARTAALAVMDGFDGHFPAGGQENWAEGKDRSDAWMLADAWIRAAIDLTFRDELGAFPGEYNAETHRWNQISILLNVMLHALAGDEASLPTTYPWFTNAADPEAPQSADAVIAAALDQALAQLGGRPWGTDKRGEIAFNHAMFYQPPLNLNPLHKMPFASRSTYAHCVEMGHLGPTRIESMFPLGQSGDIRAGVGGAPVFDVNFFSMAPVFDTFAHRPFPIFSADQDEDDVPDAVDNCPNTVNPDQADRDGDHIGDLCDPVSNIPGDINNDGEVTLADLVLALQLCAGLPTDISLNLAGADVNGDGRLSLPEAVYIFYHIALKAPPAGELIKSSTPYNAHPAAEAGDMAAMIAGFSEFTADFYHALAGAPSKNGKNLFFSGYSIENALAMTWAGANHQTADQMTAALRLNPAQERFHPALNALNIDINSRDDQPPPSGDAFSLNLVNAVWSRIGYPFLPSYLDVIAVNYDAGIRTLDFAGQPEPSRQVINQWVSDQTQQKIKDLLPAGAITPDTAVVLTNAIYFKGSWYLKFDASLTSPGPFTRLDGSSVTAQLMRRDEMDIRYMKGEGFDAVELPYVSPKFAEDQYPEELAMLVVIPHAGRFGEVESSLNKAKMDEMIASLTMGSVNFTLPKFDFTCETPCRELLMGLGMTDAFNPQASDFSGMVSPSDSRPWIDEVYHKAFVAVDETGTEAAAATAAVMTETAVPEPVTLSADKPFMFLIRDRITQAVLFMGRVVDPTLST